MKWGPTSANSSPARIVFVRSPAAKERLLALRLARQRRQDARGAGDGDHRHRHGLLREAAVPLPARRREIVVRRQEGVRRHDRVSQLEPAGRLLHHRGARGRPRLRADERLRQRARSTRSSGPGRRSGRTSSATSATAIRRSCSRAARACRSTRRAGSNERARRRPPDAARRGGRRRVVVALGAGSGFALTGALAQGLRQLDRQRTRRPRSRATAGRRCAAGRLRSSSATARR